MCFKIKMDFLQTIQLSCHNNGLIWKLVQVLEQILNTVCSHLSHDVRFSLKCKASHCVIIWLLSRETYFYMYYFKAGKKQILF